jgi:DNA (cytosine-5)-methyltransferase 1
LNTLSKDAIDDLRSGGDAPSAYVTHLNEKIGAFLERSHQSNDIEKKIVSNNDLRKHGLIVRGRFRIYQVLQLLLAENSSASAKRAAKDVLELLRGESNFLSEESAMELTAYTYYVDEKTDSHLFWQREELETFLKKYSTKKQTQRALDEAAPAPAALAIPDDACHYHRAELRTLSVREMARIQSFPDNFVFRSKATTGGEQRKFEVPQYTQVGNAVPQC